MALNLMDVGKWRAGADQKFDRFEVCLIACFFYDCMKRSFVFLAGGSVGYFNFLVEGKEIVFIEDFVDIEIG